jgi:hypothetical protein
VYSLNESLFYRFSTEKKVNINDNGLVPRLGGSSLNVVVTGMPALSATIRYMKSNA